MHAGKAIFIFLSLLFIHMAIKKNVEDIKASVKAKKQSKARYPLLHHAVGKNPTKAPPSGKKINFDPHQHA